MRAAGLALLLMPLAAHAQVMPRPGTGDPHVQTIDYVPDQVVLLQSAPGYQLMVELGSDEHIENVAVGDSGAWQVTVNHRGNRLFVKPLQDGVTTNMTVISDARLYSFDLTPLSSPRPDMAYSVRFRYPSTATGSQASGNPDHPAGRYILKGAETLKPDGMHDDGVHTYIEWPEAAALPAIYALDDHGKEMLVNGQMRDGRMVIDSVYMRLVFRIDDRKAMAIRQAVEKP